MSNLSLMEEEVILDVDGIVPTQPVFQHIGLSAWPGEIYIHTYLYTHKHTQTYTTNGHWLLGFNGTQKITFFL